MQDPGRALPGSFFPRIGVEYVSRPLPQAVMAWHGSVGYNLVDRFLSDASTVDRN